MSLMKKLFKRNKKEANVTSTASAVTAEKTENFGIPRSFVTSASPSDDVDASSELCSSNVDGDSESDDDDSEYEQKRRRLQSALHSLKASEARKARRQKEVLAMEAEIEGLLRMIALCRLQREHMGEDVQNKKCEMKFLRTEAPEGYEAESKKREPLLYKKYVNLKSVTEARNHLNTIRNRQRALQYLELMTYNKYLEFQHNLKVDTVKKRTSVMLKDKTRNFGHLIDVLQRRIESGITQTQGLDFSTQSSAETPADLNVSNTLALHIQGHGAPSGGSSPIDAVSVANEMMPFDVTPPRSTTVILPLATTPPLQSFPQFGNFVGHPFRSPDMDVD